MLKEITAAEASMQFGIFCSNRDLDGSILEGVAFDQWVPYQTNTKVWYSSTESILPVVQREIKDQQPDFLVITGIYDWNYNLKPLLFCKGVKKIISVRGMLHPGALSQKGFKKKIYLTMWKLLGLHKKNTFHATDEAEKKYIQDTFGTGVKIKIAANFPHVLQLQPAQIKHAGFLKLASIALVSPMKNILLVLEALRKLGAGPGTERDGNIHIEYDIYGPVKDKAYWEQCETLINTLPAKVKVQYQGDIPPAGISAALAACHVFVLPSKSENFGHSIYEALSSGRPVITSNNTPWVELAKAKAGINVSVDGIAALEQAIHFFVHMNQEEFRAWNIGAREYAEKAIDTDRISRQYLEMFR